MGAAAGVEVETVDLHEPERSLEVSGKQPGTHPERLHFIRLRGPHRHGMGRADLVGHRILETVEIVRAQRGGVELDVADRRPHVERRGRPSESLQRHHCEQVLPGVLLHVIETTRPVDLHRDRTGLDLSLEKMADHPVDLLNIHHADAAHGPAV